MSSFRQDPDLPVRVYYALCNCFVTLYQAVCLCKFLMVKYMNSLLVLALETVLLYLEILETCGKSLFTISFTVP